MPTFEKLAAGKKSTRANMQKQIQELGLDETVRKKPTTRKEEDGPGTKKYLERRQRDYEKYDRE